MDFLLNRYRNLTVLLVVIVGQLLLLAYQVKGNQDVRLIRTWAVVAVTPVARLLEAVRSGTAGFVRDYFGQINVRDENRRLREEVGKLKLENHFLKSELSTADRARALVAFQSRTPSRTEPARIIGTGTGSNSRVVFIDRGSGSGVRRGMAVITPDGIVGRVLASYPTASQVLLVTDPSFAAGVISQKGRVHGTLKGQGHSTCIVDYIQNEEKVEQGERFFTSGDDRVFPKGLPAGTVTVVRPGRSLKEVYVVPTGLQNGLEEVLVVVEGIHQPVPAESTASPEMSLLPPPPAETPGERQPARISGTDADRLREKYKRVGDAQGHVFGEGLPGSRPPDFNLDPGAVKPRPPAVAGAKLPADVKPPASPPAKPDGSAVKPPPEGGRNPEAPAPAPPGP